MAPARTTTRRTAMGWVLAIGCAFSAASVAQAQQPQPQTQQEDVEPIGISYDAPAGCPDSSAFFREIAARTARARSARSGEKARVLHVAIVLQKKPEKAAANAFTGRLLIEDAATWSSAREVSGATCAEVVEALGLIGALAVDPKASTAPRAAAAAAAAAGAANTPNNAADTATASTATTSSTAAPPNTTQPDNTSKPPPVAPPDRDDDRKRRPRFGFGVQADGSFIAELVGMGRLFGDIELGARDGRQLFEPSVRIAIAQSLDVERRPTVGSAKIRWTLGSIEGCPLRVSITSTLGLRPCAGVSAGVLDAEGTGVGSAKSRSRPWTSISAQGRVVWEPTRFLALELELGVLTPLFRESFFFETSVPIYRAPIFAAFGRFGGSVRFP